MNIRVYAVLAAELVRYIDLKFVLLNLRILMTASFSLAHNIVCTTRDLQADLESDLVF